jgi:hypothetical protein
LDASSKDSVLTQLQLVRAFDAVRRRLERLLAIDLSPDGRGLESEVGGILLGVVGLSADGDPKSALYSLLKAFGLATDLELVRGHAPGLFRLLKKRLRTDQRSQYYGARCELATAAAFIKKGIAFRQGKAGSEPDFVLPLPDGEVGVECTSAHWTGDMPEKDLTYKVSAAIRAKRRKRYHRSSVILCLDYTNLLFEAADPNLLAHPDTRATFAAALEATQFAAMLLFAYQVDETTGDYYRTYQRIDRERAPTSVRRFLDEHYPPTGRNLIHVAIPVAG